MLPVCDTLKKGVTNRLTIEEWRVLSSEILTWVDDNVPIILRVPDVLRVSQSIAGGTGDACVTIGSVVIA